MAPARPGEAAEEALEAAKKIPAAQELVVLHAKTKYLQLWLSYSSLDRRDGNGFADIVLSPSNIQRIEHHLTHPGRAAALFSMAGVSQQRSEQIAEAIRFAPF